MKEMKQFLYSIFSVTSISKFIDVLSTQNNGKSSGVYLNNNFFNRISFSIKLKASFLYGMKCV